ncbi:MAG: hypothetical protein ACI9FR_002804 [Cryomorphaceae bacterium]|jgi:hypothetical protein
MTKPAFWMLLATVIVMPIHHAAAVETLSAKELALHCKVLPEASESIDGQYCIRYIQGFIDGAVTTDVRVMMNVEAESKREETIAERAFRTRLPSRSDEQRAAGYAEFCLGDPLPLKEVVAKVVADLDKDFGVSESSKSARNAVYASLRRHYPCKDSQ